ncbi:MAG: SDR family oxidoreductase [Alphaproteobacteria bacterium]|jgi:NAD(P)-dependent dehydrogenase (short-subunit alcohol dehydrogenase family)|nr:SDR family oxidoreductase [Alphaproteobacteria bacterium]
MKNRSVLLITGGSRGIGAATARLAASRGYDVCLSYASRPEAAEEVAAEVRAAGGRGLAVRADCGRAEDIDGLFAVLDAEFGRLDVLVNNAGYLDRAAPIEEITAERLARLFAVNVAGCFLCARQAVLRMAPRHGGRGGAIVTVSSRAASLGGTGGLIDYAATKGALDTFTIGLAKELAGDGIRVNAVRPGLVDTDIHENSGVPGRMAQLVPSVPLGRAGTAEEVAEAILWLASDAASYCTGMLLDVAGGR